MLLGGRVVGAVHADTTSREATFDAASLELLGLVANVIAGAAHAEGIIRAERLPSTFISYSHQDRDTVDRLVADLRRRRVKVWFDERLETGAPWREQQLATAIAASDGFVIGLSPASVASDEVHKELAEALRCGRRIFPLLFHPTPLPLSLLTLHYARLDDRYDECLDAIANALHEHVRGGDPP